MNVSRRKATRIVKKTVTETVNNEETGEEEDIEKVID